MRYSILMLLFGLLLLGCQPTEQSQSNLKYNLYSTDDLGYGELRCLLKKNKNPNLDRLAAEGIIHTALYWSTVCIPSRLFFEDSPGHAYIRGNYELGQFEDENEEVKCHTKPHPP